MSQSNVRLAIFAALVAVIVTLESVSATIGIPSATHAIGDSLAIVSALSALLANQKYNGPGTNGGSK